MVCSNFIRGFCGFLEALELRVFSKRGGQKIITKNLIAFLVLGVSIVKMDPLFSQCENKPPEVLFSNPPLSALRRQIPNPSNLGKGKEIIAFGAFGAPQIPREPGGENCLEKIFA